MSQTVELGIPNSLETATCLQLTFITKAQIMPQFLLEQLPYIKGVEKMKLLINPSYLSRKTVSLKSNSRRKTTELRKGTKFCPFLIYVVKSLPKGSVHNVECDNDSSKVNIFCIITQINVHAEKGAVELVIGAAELVTAVIKLGPDVIAVKNLSNACVIEGFELVAEFFDEFPNKFELVARSFNEHDAPSEYTNI
ncbi:hypothetical protein BDF21DRAFT_449784 [Thamnidium elegans]|nr:hypothetical protein BDF21DRAFT_449784 [Thamnidium elegans]